MPPHRSPSASILWNVDFDPRFARAENGKRRFDTGSSGMIHNFNREYGSTPALALRADAFLPTGPDSKEVGFRLRATTTNHILARRQSHLNLDLRR